MSDHRLMKRYGTRTTHVVEQGRRVQLRTVLAVDDDDDIRYLTQLAIECSTNWIVLTAASGCEAPEIAGRTTPDVVLMDMMMPDMDGVAAFRRLKDERSARGIPVILFTAKTPSPVDRLHKMTPLPGSSRNPTVH